MVPYGQSFKFLILVINISYSAVWFKPLDFMMKATKTTTTTMTTTTLLSKQATTTTKSYNDFISYNDNKR